MIFSIVVVFPLPRKPPMIILSCLSPFSIIKLFFLDGQSIIYFNIYNIGSAAQISRVADQPILINCFPVRLFKKLLAYKPFKYRLERKLQ